MSRKDETVDRIADLLGIKYTHAFRLVRAVKANSNADFIFSDLAHACRALKEEEESRRRNRPRGALPKGAGRVNCGDCDATAAADGKGSPIVLIHDDGCREKYPIKDHRYDAGFPRDDSEGCIAALTYIEDGVEGVEQCGQPLSEHERSEYPEDGR